MAAGNKVLLALQILAVYAKPNDLGLVPEHDEIWIGHDIGPDGIGEAAAKKLGELGFEWDEDIPAWHAFL